MSLRLDLDDDIDEDPDDDEDFERDDDDDDDDEADSDEDEEEPETWQVASTPRHVRQEYSKSSTCACESPKGRFNLTFQPLAA